MKMKPVVFASIVSLQLVVATGLQAADRMQPGKWEFSMTRDGSTHTSTRCVTAEEAGSVNGDTKSARAHAEKSAKNCTVDAYDIHGDRVSYKLTCAGATIESAATYHGNSFEGDLKSVRAGKEATTHVKAHRLAACP